MSIIRRNSRAAKFKMRTAHYSPSLRKILIREKGGQASRDGVRICVKKEGNGAYFAAFKKYILSEINETSAAIFAAEKDFGSLQKKYHSFMSGDTEGLLKHDLQNEI